MTCNTVTIEEYLHEHLTPDAEVMFESHLDSCLSCQTALQQLSGDADSWSEIATALRCNEFDPPAVRDSLSDSLAAGGLATIIPTGLLGPTDDPRMMGRIGPFEVAGCVGMGGMGIVFKAKDPSLDRYVAVKMLAPHLAISSTARERFSREAKASAAVVHDNVIAIYQVSDWRGLPYLVMPYLPGPSLEQRLQRDGRLDVVEALRIACQVADGLSAAHAQGLVHRDIKPANILLSGETERAVITDFGLARAADDATITRAGTLTGTPQYMAPEQARGENVNATSDLFSLGSVLYAMLTGYPPVLRDTGTETIHVVGTVAPSSVNDARPDLPAWVSRLVGKLHAFNPVDRVADANTASTLLSASLAHAQDPSTNPLPVEIGDASIAPGRRGHWVGLAALAIAGIAIANWGISNHQQQPTSNHSQSEVTRPQPKPTGVDGAMSAIAADEVDTLSSDEFEHTLNLEFQYIDASLTEIEQWLFEPPTSQQSPPDFPTR